MKCCPYLVLALVWTVLAAGCIDGARVQGEIPPEFLGPRLDPDAVSVGGDDAVAAQPDVDAGPDGDVAVAVPDGDATAAVEVDSGPAGDADVDQPPCIPGVDDCPGCTVDAECLAADDGDLCNGTWVCAAGQCVEDPAPVECDQGDAGPCADVACDPATGGCVLQPKTNLTLCTDADPCTVGDRCVDGVCLGSPSIYCDDGNPCTADKCSGGKCIFQATSGACDDGNPCTTDDTCAAGKCKGGGASVCSCVGDGDCAVFEDGNLCNGTLSCVEGLCVVAPATVVTCAEQAPGACARERCDPETGGCEAVDLPDGSGCDDGVSCTSGDACTAGACAGVEVLCETHKCFTGACNEDSGTCDMVKDEDGTSCGAGPCAVGACDDGTCVPSVGQCACVEDEDCAGYDDGDACTGTWACFQGRCALDRATLPDCPEPPDACQVAACDAATGQCVLEPAEDGLACDDGDACAGPDACVGGACEPAVATCDPPDDCHQALCHAFAGCQIVPLGAACAAEGLCTAAAGCAGGACFETAFVTCAASGDCVSAACEQSSGECVESPAEGTCDDGDGCTIDDACAAGVCAGAPVVCDDGEPCTTDACSAALGACEHTAKAGKLCDDGNACTVGDVCGQDGCVGEATGACQCAGDEDCLPLDDGDACTGTLFCDAGTCRVDGATVVQCIADETQPCESFECVSASGACEWVALGDGLACDDGDPCTGASTCSAGECAGPAIACDDGNPCTIGTCDSASGCVYSPTSGPCDDGNACTASSICSFGTCAGTDDTCTCTSDGDCVAQEDGDVCNGTLICDDGKCVVDLATVVICADDGDPCVATSCVPATGACVDSPADGAGCDDGDPCTTGDTCAGGGCVGGEPPSCDDGNPCTAGSCDPATGGCSFAAAPDTACDDGNPCTTGDACVGAACAGAENLCACTVDADCDAQITNKCLGVAECAFDGCALVPDSEVQCASEDDTPCAFLGCDPATGGCVQVVLEEGVACDDGDPCTTATTCGGDGTCGGVPTDCDDGSSCTEDTCEAGVGCVHTAVNEGSPCDDSDFCTTGEACVGGACVGGAGICPCNSAAQCPTGGDKCANVYACEGALCAKLAPVQCPAPTNQCKQSLCSPATGECSVSNAPDATPCDDGNACTNNDRCVFGSCTGDKKQCTDDNPCTIDQCAEGACLSTPADDSTSCDDGDPCTFGDTCSGGVCAAGQDLCGCSQDSYCMQFFDDGDACNGAWACVEGYCADLGEASIITCEDPNPNDCLDPQCDPGGGGCFLFPRATGTPCDDGTACTTNDACDAAGGCSGTPFIFCEDDVPDDCVDVVCHPVSKQCVPQVREDEATCDDQSACTAGDRCVAGGCQGELIDCDDDNGCTADACSSLSGCTHAFAFGPCDDGNACTQPDVCSAGACKGIVNTCGECDGSQQCQAFDDDDPCNGTLDCIQGACKVDPATVLECEPDPELPCMLPICVAGEGCGLEPAPDWVSCDDGSGCTTGDRCLAGECVGDPCDDDNPCTADACDAGAGECIHQPVEDGAPCEDGDECNGADACLAGACAAGAEALCGCVEDGDCAAFDDADLCDGNLVCDPATGQCVANPASVVTCALDPSGCLTYACDPASGECVAEAAEDGTPCSDSDLCTLDDRCAAGVCGGEDRNCSDGNPCTLDVCDVDGGCVHQSFVGPCDDGDPCTKGEVCGVNGKCLGPAQNCNDDSFCTTDSCVPGEGCRNTPKADGTACNLPDFCIDGEKCQGGVCTGSGNLCPCAADEDCEGAGDDDLCKGSYVCDTEGSGGCVIDPATIPTCAPASECLASSCDPDTGECLEEVLNEGGACDDGAACTAGDTCVAGACAGDPVVCEDTGDPCTEKICVKGKGCIAQDVIGDCDDGNECTGLDHCVEGACVGLSLDEADTFQTFDDITSPPALASTGVEAGWRLSGLLVASPPLALHAVNPVTGALDDPAGVWEAVATLSPVALPTGTLAVELQFALWMDVGDGSCDAQVLDLLVDGELVAGAEWCDGTGMIFVPVSVDLPHTPGQALEVAFRYRSISGEPLGGAGVVLDDVLIDVACPPF